MSNHSGVVVAVPTIEGTAVVAGCDVWEDCDSAGAQADRTRKKTGTTTNERYSFIGSLLEIVALSEYR
jgi:hypothetical protein